MPWPSDIGGTARAGRRGQDGFSLLELLVALAIIGLAMGLVAPRIGLAGPGVKADARVLAGALKLAREQAIMAGRDALFTIDPATGRWDVPAAGRSGRLSGRASLTVTADRGEAGGGVAAVRFFPDGSSSGMEIVLTAGEVRRTLRVDWLTGRVSDDGAG